MIIPVMYKVSQVCVHEQGSCLCATKSFVAIFVLVVIGFGG